MSSEAAMGNAFHSYLSGVLQDLGVETMWAPTAAQHCYVLRIDWIQTEGVMSALGCMEKGAGVMFIG